MNEQVPKQRSPGLSTIQPPMPLREHACSPAPRWHGPLIRFTDGRVGDVIHACRNGGRRWRRDTCSRLSWPPEPPLGPRRLCADFGYEAPRPAARIIARAAVDSISHQICDIVDVIEARSGSLQLFRADGGATRTSALVVQTQADLFGREVEVSEVAEVSALGAASFCLAGTRPGERLADRASSSCRIYRPVIDSIERRRRRERWAGEVSGPGSLGRASRM